jgi:DNA topoisomerase-1
MSRPRPRTRAARAGAVRGYASTPDQVRAALPRSLRYVTRFDPGWTRERTRRGFRYLGPTGRVIVAPRELDRIRRLAIPPAWTDVWICPRADGHLQAAGRDARGRWQYRYHSRLREVREEAKFGHLLEFGRVLPAIRRRVRRDLRAPPLSRPAVLATVVDLLERTLIRVGNEEYARTNQSFGLTTLRDRHVTIRRDRLRFHFRGKSGKWRELELRDPRLAREVGRLQELPGQEIFQYVDESGQRRRISSADVNDYLRAAAGTEVTAKDFRTWAGTVVAAGWLGDPEFAAGPRTKRRLNEVIARVAEQLGNTPAICRRCYIHPEILADYLGGRGPKVPAGGWSRGRGTGLNAAERALLTRLGRAAHTAARPVRKAPRRPEADTSRAEPVAAR